MKTALRYIPTFIPPFIMLLALPYLILWLEHGMLIPRVTGAPVLLIAGLVLAVTGLLLAVATFRMFILIGRGTIMPWDPTRRLITGSLYGYVRNPMILSLIVTQVGEAVLFSSYGIAALAIFNFILNTVYFIFSEEPGLEMRFGAEYAEYKNHVPRWIPRLKPWHPQ